MTRTYLIVIMLLVTACGRDDASETRSTGSSAPTITGTFKTGCLATANGWYAIVTMTNTDTQSVVEKAQYFDSACVTIRIQDTATRTYKLGDASGTGYAIDIVTTKDERVYRVATNVDSANRDKGFGYSDWTINVPKDISGNRYSSAYPVEPKTGSTAYQLYDIRDSEYYGADLTTGDATTQEKRPTAVVSIGLKK